jgi:integrase
MDQERRRMPRGRPKSSAGPRLILIKKPGRQPIYYIEHDENGQRRRVSTGAGDRREADQAFTEWLRNQAHKPPTGKRDPAKVLIAEILNAYAKAQEAKADNPEPGDTDDIILVRERKSERIGFAMIPLLAWWGPEHTVADIKITTCEEYRNARLRGDVRRLDEEQRPTPLKTVKLATISRELGILRSALSWAVQNELLTSAPFVKLPPKQPGRDRWLTRSEVARLLWSARQEPKARLHLPLFILLALYTGARSEAILTLKWFPQVNLDRSRIDYNPPRRPQTLKRRPQVRIAQRLRTFLILAKTRTNSPYVLTWHGDPIGSIKHSLASAANRAGLDGVTAHTLRHTCGTWLAQAGVPLYEIAGILGHTNARTTELYAHHHPDFQKNATEALDRPRNRA